MLDTASMLWMIPNILRGGTTQTIETVVQKLDLARLSVRPTQHVSTTLKSRQLFTSLKYLQ